jgi:hypothetical protein
MSFQTNFNEGQKQSNHILSHFSFEFKQTKTKENCVIVVVCRYEDTGRC